MGIQTAAILALAFALLACVTETGGSGGHGGASAATSAASSGHGGAASSPASTGPGHFCFSGGVGGHCFHEGDAG